MAKTLAKVLVSGNVQLQMALDKILEYLLESQPKSCQDDTKHDDILQSLLYQQDDVEKILFSWIHQKSLCTSAICLLLGQNQG